MVLKCFKLTANPKALKNLKISWKKSWNLKSLTEFEPCNRASYPG